MFVMKSEKLSDKDWLPVFLCLRECCFLIIIFCLFTFYQEQQTHKVTLKVHEVHIDFKVHKVKHLSHVDILQECESSYLQSIDIKNTSNSDFLQSEHQTLDVPNQFRRSAINSNKKHQSAVIFTDQWLSNLV